MAPPISRRTFLKGLLATTGTVLLGNLGYQTLTAAKPIPGKLMGPSSTMGHKIRDHQPFPEPSETMKTDIIIVGGGIAGLSAAWWLKKQGYNDFLLLEMEKKVGGNAQSGRNAISGYPWGAHYVPIPSPESSYVRMLFEELGVIQGYSKAGLPIYNDLYLCHDPDERLLKDGRWQDGLVPVRGTLESDKQDIERFLVHMNTYKESIGKDGQRAFAVPLDLSSQDEEFLALDQISMKDWLQREGFQSKLLDWYVNYCCRDDYGAPPDQVSAWAGIHYFAARNSKAANAEPQAVLTWPEGNGWLVERLRERIEPNIHTQAVVYHIEEASDSVHSHVVNQASGKVVNIQAKQVIFAGPRFVAAHIIPSLQKSEYLSSLDYSPWLVANISLNQLPNDGEGIPLAWDNVNYHNQSLGYVVATHQNITLFPTKTVLTYYRPLDEGNSHAVRQKAFAMTHTEWAKMILSDLKTMHPFIENDIANMDIWVWGHGMIRPSVGYIWGPLRQAMLQPMGRIHFAHSDMSGISIFEEAQYRGIVAAQTVLGNIGV